MPSLISSWGGNQDTTYILLKEADDYILGTTTPTITYGSKIDAALWEEATDKAKAAAILSATRDVDNALFFDGERQFVDQLLEFPRIPAGEQVWPWVQRSLTSANTFNIYLAEQKRRVKAATAEQAFSLIRDGERNEDVERQLRGIRSFSEGIGPIHESASYGGSVLPLCPEAMKLLNPYISGSLPLYRA